MKKTIDKFDNLKSWFIPVNQIFREFRQYTLDYMSKNKRRIFIDNGSKILFIAHLDTIEKPHFYRNDNIKVYASGLDDRLGCWTAYVLSKQLQTDLLLCDNEEQGRSTALHHICKEYNWIAEFDRGGGDVVTYNLDSIAFEKALEKYFKIGFGSFSDISFLKTTACCVNIGIGYYAAHRKSSYADLPTFKKQIENFKKFYYQYKDTVFERDYFIEPFIDGFGNYAKSFDYKYDICELCGDLGTSIYEHILCENCLEEMIATYFNLCY